MLNVPRVLSHGRAIWWVDLQLINAALWLDRKTNGLAREDFLDH